MLIAVDFDGTIVENDYPKIGKLLPGSISTINKWYDDGHEIIIWTCRNEFNELSEMKHFLYSNGIKFDYINENSPSIDFKPVPKIYYDILIDDRNFDSIIDWAKIDKRFDELYDHFIETKLKGK